MYAWTTQEEVSGATYSPHLFLDCLVLERRREKGEDQLYKSFVLDRYFVNTYFRVILVEGETKNPVCSDCQRRAENHAPWLVEGAEKRPPRYGDPR